MDDYKDNLGVWVLGSVLALILAVAVITLLSGWGAIWGRTLGKFNEESRRQIQEESRAYQEGMAQNIDKLCLEWERTGNSAVAQSIRHRTAGYNGKLPEHLQQCVNLARKVN